MDKTISNIFFNTRDELTKVCLDDVMYVTSDGNYITLNYKSGRSSTLLASLQNFIQATEYMGGHHFERIGKSHVVNIAYISQINTLRKTIVLVDDDMNERVEIVVSKEAIRALKATMMDCPKTVISNFKTSNGNMEAFLLVK